MSKESQPKKGSAKSSSGPTREPVEALSPEIRRIELPKASHNEDKGAESVANFMEALNGEGLDATTVSIGTDLVDLGRKEASDASGERPDFRPELPLEKAQYLPEALPQIEGELLLVEKDSTDSVGAVLWGEEFADVPSVLRFDEEAEVKQVFRRLPLLGGLIISKTGSFRYRFLISFVGLVCLVPLFLLFLNLTFNSGSTAVPDSESQTRFQTSEGNNNVVPLVTPRTFAKQFIEADVEKRIQFLRDPTRDAQPLREHFEAMSAAGREAKLEVLKPLHRSYEQGLTVIPFVAKFTDGRTRYVANVVDETGKQTIDWPAYARAGSYSWENYAVLTGEEAEMRVYVTPSDYYNVPFDDQDKYHSYRLVTPDWNSQSINAFVRIGTHQNSILERALDKRRGVRMVLSLVNSSQAPGELLLEINQIVALTWVKGDEDYDTSVFAVHVPDSLDQELQRKKESMDYQDIELAPTRASEKFRASRPPHNLRLPRLKY